MLKYLNLKRYVAWDDNSAFWALSLLSMLWMPVFLFSLIFLGFAWWAFGRNEGASLLFSYLFLIFSAFFPLLLIFIVLRAWSLYIDEQYTKSVNWMFYAFVIVLFTLGLGRLAYLIFQ